MRQRLNNMTILRAIKNILAILCSRRRAKVLTLLILGMIIKVHGNRSKGAQYSTDIVTQDRKS